MKLRAGIAVLLLGGVLAACEPAPPNVATTQPVVDKGPSPPAGSRLSARFIGFIGPKLQHDAPYLGVPYTNFYCLRSVLDRQTGETAHQLYVADSYSGAVRDWDAARDAAGNVLPVTHISTNELTCENGCAYAEEFAATLPEAELRSSGRALAVTFTARSGDAMTIKLSEALIESQLAAVDAARSRLPPPARP
jgi:hypothetical protein